MMTRAQNKKAAISSLPITIFSKMATLEEELKDAADHEYHAIKAAIFHLIAHASPRALCEILWQERVIHVDHVGFACKPGAWWSCVMCSRGAESPQYTAAKNLQRQCHAKRAEVEFFLS